MTDLLKPYLLCFIPMFVAVNAIGVLPIFISLTEEMDIKDRRKTIYTTVMTATLIALIFLFIGKAILVLNMIIVLLIFRLADLLAKIMGKAGMRAASKIAYILLASIAVNMIRIGIFEIIKTG